MPLIAWTIRSALLSGCFGRIIVSTDSDEIAEISTRYGAEVPFLRPSNLSTDAASSVDVVLHLIDFLDSSEGYVANEVCVLQPTSPFRTAEDIVRARTLFSERQANAVISVARCLHSPLWTNTLGPDGSMQNFLSNIYSGKRSQDLPDFFRLNGAIYWIRAALVCEHHTLFPDTDIFACEMDELHSVDIDTRVDFEYAEFLIERGYISPPEER